MNKNRPSPDKQLEQYLDALRPTLERNPAMAARSRALFLEQARRMRPEALRRLENQRKQTSSSRPKRTRPLWNALFAVFLALVFFFGGTGITAYAARESMPDEVLYPLKTLSEDVRLLLASSPQERIDLNLGFVDRRVNEIASLYASREAVPQEVTDRLRIELNAILEDAAKLDDQAMTRALERVMAQAESQWTTMSVLAAEHPEDVNLAYAVVWLQQQIDLAAEGEVDPQGFRMRVGQQGQFTSGTITGAPTSENGQSATDATSPQGTPIPGGNGNEAGQGENQPTDAQGPAGAAPQSSTAIPQGTSAQSGSGSGQGQQGPAATQTPHSGSGAGRGP